MRAVILVLITALLAGCSDDDNATPKPTAESSPQPSTSTTAEASTTSTTISRVGDCPNRPTGSSAAQFDPAAGTYAAQSVSLADDSTSLTFDVIQWLSGEDARLAWRDDFPDDPTGPPNDYYIVNESDRVRTAPVNGDATVFLTHLRTDGTASVEPDTLEALGGYIRDTSDTYWLTFDSNVITEICEQYRP